MTQFLRPVSSLVVSGSWGLVGAPTHHEAIDEGVAGTDGNASYIQGSSALGIIDFDMLAPIEPGGVRTGFALTMIARRFGASFNPDTEPRVRMSVFRGSDPTVIATGIAFIAIGGTVFTAYGLPLTEFEASTLWPVGTVAPTIRVRLEMIQCLGTHSMRDTTLEMSLPDPLIIIDPAVLTFTFPAFDIVLGSGMGTDRGEIATAEAEAGCVAVAGSEAGWINECP